MIKLKNSVNKSEVMKQIKLEAIIIYDGDWEGEIRSKDFISGAGAMFKKLRVSKTNHE